MILRICLRLNGRCKRFRYYEQQLRPIHQKHRPSALSSACHQLLARRRLLNSTVSTLALLCTNVRDYRCKQATTII
ncbi:hypothetical protein CCHR01_06974 [Colletotrichum chrysophilum]|uniref:Uncharacterized protein n=1 Tax=Colletotrichum chrysophilum TaxID=1836956 RepID=A0AAD9EK64_9PEZI|nr:hypothetical protein CCHR01_06974 [Colletotrichum chrysophilum]